MLEKEIAACGLLCDECFIFKAHSDKNAAREMLDWMIETHSIDENTTLEEFMEDTPFCEGCHGNKKNHWSPDCWILQCCTNDKDLDNCSQCDYFACDRLIDWSKESEDYKKAFERLREKKF